VRKSLHRVLKRLYNLRLARQQRIGEPLLRVINIEQTAVYLVPYGVPLRARLPLPSLPN
jgi:hypothetical protein